MASWIYVVIMIVVSTIIAGALFALFRPDSAGEQPKKKEPPEA